MFHRIIKPLKSNSFFLFGPRGSGKSTWVASEFAGRSFTIDLLSDETEQRYFRQPDLLSSDIKALPPSIEWIIVDEIQKAPKLLDVVHSEIERSKKRKFILTGSSARKLKRNAANLLAGRAFVEHLHPLVTRELSSSFNLDFCLHWGTLPKIFSLEGDEERSSFLKSYTQTYLKEEVLFEQLVRNGQSFRDFLLIAGLENGNTLNFSKIAKDLNADTKTVQNFFSILEDTLVGFFLPAYHRSVRKSQKQQPKFYIFDTGVKRAMEGTLKSQLVPRTTAYGKAFEHWVILEFFRMNQYTKADFRLSHYQETKGAEIDLLLTHGKETWAIEIKSSNRVDASEVDKLAKLGKVLGAKRTFYLSQDVHRSVREGVECLSWSDGLVEIFK